jgi:uncharacterized protein (TIGR02328 family)
MKGCFKMRLWAEQIISELPRQQLLGQHRECSALRGGGWLKPHSTINYIFKYSPARLYKYHLLIMKEMERRGYTIHNKQWYDMTYRGLKTTPWDDYIYYEFALIPDGIIYPEHNEKYIEECVSNLEGKGIKISA